MVGPTGSLYDRTGVLPVSLEGPTGSVYDWTGVLPVGIYQ